MSSPWKPFFDSIYDGYRAAFPGAIGVVKHPIFRVTNAMRWNYVDLIQREELVAPWAIVQMPVPTPYSPIGPNARYRCQPVLWYVFNTTGRTHVEQDMEAALYELDHALRSIAVYTLLADPVYDVAETNQLNASFLPQGSPYFAGCLRMDVAYGWIKASLGDPDDAELPDLGGGLYSPLRTANTALTPMDGGLLPQPPK